MNIKKLNLQKIQKLASKIMKKHYGDRFNYSIEGNALKISTVYPIKDNCNVDFDITVSEWGHIFGVVHGNAIDCTLENLELINTFNSETVWQKAYIDKKGHLIFKEHTRCFDEGSIASIYIPNFYSSLDTECKLEDKYFFSLISKMHK